MPTPDPPDWATLRALYETGGVTLREVAEASGATLGALKSRSRREGWRKAGPTGRRPDTERSKAAKSTSDLPRRLRALVDRKLRKLEERMETQPDTTAADSEREAREIGALIRNFERLEALGGAEPAGGPQRAAAGFGQEQAVRGTDAEQWRSELARRIARLRQQLGV